MLLLRFRKGGREEEEEVYFFIFRLEVSSSIAEDLALPYPSGITPQCPRALIQTHGIWHSPAPVLSASSHCLAKPCMRFIFIKCPLFAQLHFSIVSVFQQVSYSSCMSTSCFSSKLFISPAAYRSVIHVNYKILAFSLFFTNSSLSGPHMYM